MSPNQTLILRRLEQGPAGTADLCAVTGGQQGNTHKTMQRLMAAGLVKNTGVSWKARWELVKQGDA
jgi:DNA-binding IclR family transcriptional regulator